MDRRTIDDFKKRHGVARGANSISHPSFWEEVAAKNPIIRLLISEAEVTVSWSAPYSSPERYEKVLRLGNDKDVMMVLDTLRLLCQSGCPNVYCFLLKQIRSDGPRAAYRALESLHGVADKLATMTIRDLGIIHPNLITTDFESVFPIDTWVRQVAALLGCEVENDEEIKKHFIRECHRHELNLMLFVAGMWYLAANSLEILLRECLGRHPMGG